VPASYAEPSEAKPHESHPPASWQAGSVRQGNLITRTKIFPLSIIAVVALSQLSGCVSSEPAAHSADKREVPLHVFNAPKQFSGGEFSSDSSYLQRLCGCAPDGEVIFDIFPDGLFIKYDRSGIGFVYLLDMGVWERKGEKIALYFASNPDWRKPDAQFRLARIGETDDQAMPALIEIPGPASPSELDLLLNSFLQKRPEKEIEAARAQILHSFLDQDKE